MKVPILAGGSGTRRLTEETDVRSEPMIKVRDRPPLWHILKRYEDYGCLTDLVTSSSEPTSGMTSASQRTECDRVASGRQGFVSREIKGQGDAPTNILSTVGTTSVQFSMEFPRTARRHHGVARCDFESDLSGRMTREPSPKVVDQVSPLLFPDAGVRLGTTTCGEHGLYDDDEPQDVWESFPDMIAAVETFQHSLDRWYGISNVASEFFEQVGMAR